MLQNTVKEYYWYAEKHRRTVQKRNEDIYWPCLLKTRIVCLRSYRQLGFYYLSYFSKTQLFFNTFPPIVSPCSVSPWPLLLSLFLFPRTYLCRDCILFARTYLCRFLFRVCITDHDVSGEPGFSDGKLSYLAYVKETCPTTVEEHCQVTRVMRLTSGFRVPGDMYTIRPSLDWKHHTSCSLSSTRTRVM